MSDETAMHVLICSERFLFRFGLDRVLLLLAEGLARRGHRVTLMGLRLDPQAVSCHADRIIDVPDGGLPYDQLDHCTSRWMASNWATLFPPGDVPDVAVVGGWPFFGSIPVLRRYGVATVFFDCGAVPLEGLSGPELEVQQTLRGLRRLHLREANAAIAISEFIAESQTRVDCLDLVPVHTHLLGASHLEAALRRSAPPGPGRRVTEPVDKALEAVGSGRRLILNLGRWEPGCYKNSEAILDIARELRTRGAPDFTIAVLERSESLFVPKELDGAITPLGFPDDVALHQIVGLTDIGISVSKWEGFNLPVAEMQWSGKPALALDVGAHPEIICHPWCLAEDVAGLTEKIAEFLAAGFPDRAGLTRGIEEFRARFDWAQVQERYADTLASVARSERPAILLDVSNACRDEANTGVMRVARQLSKCLRSRAEVAFVVWDATAGTYVLPTEAEYELLGRFNGPRTGALPRSPGNIRMEAIPALIEQGMAPKWLLLTQIVDERRAAVIRGSASTRGIRVAALFFDAIPVLHPEFVTDALIRRNHAEYMRGLAECDVVIPISEFSRDCLEQFWSREEVYGAPTHVVALPEEFGAAPRRTTAKRFMSGGTFGILCVSTLEPRKNHLVLLAAVAQLSDLVPGLDWRLNLVGNRCAGAETLALAVLAAGSADRRIRWLGVVDDATLHRLYEEASVSVYGSLIEGFGMPIVESLWHATPVICHKRW